MDLKELVRQIQKEGVCLPGYEIQAKRHWLWDSAILEEPDYVDTVHLGTIDEREESGTGSCYDIYAGVTIPRKHTERPWVDVLFVEEYTLHENKAEEWTLWLVTGKSVPKILTQEVLDSIEKKIYGE